MGVLINFIFIFCTQIQCFFLPVNKYSPIEDTWPTDLSSQAIPINFYFSSVSHLFFLTTEQEMASFHSFPYLNPPQSFFCHVSLNWSPPFHGHSGCHSWVHLSILDSTQPIPLKKHHLLCLLKGILKLNIVNMSIYKSKGSKLLNAVEFDQDLG